MSANRSSNVARHHIRVHVVEATVLAKGDRRDNGNVVGRNQVVQQGAIDSRDATNTAQLGACLLRNNDASIRTRYAHGEIAMTIKRSTVRTTFIA